MELHKPYYQVTLTHEGQFPFNDAQKVCFVEIGSDVHINITPGSKVANQCKLMINFPIKENNKLKYTLVEPKKNQSQSSNIVENQPKYHFSQRQERLEVVLPERVSLLGTKTFILYMQHAGSFFFQVEYLDEDTNEICYSDPQYIFVEPKLEIQTKHKVYSSSNQKQFEYLNTKSIQLITVLSRSLGRIEQWPQFFKEQKALGYNMIHFTPIQRYGISQSLYSIRDHNALDSIYFPQDTKLTHEEQLKYLKRTIQTLKSEQGWLCLVDIVLNHAARNADWIVEHPEATYNLDNCPWLNAAYELDKAILKFSHEYAQCKISSCVRAPFIENENDLMQMLSALKIEVLDKLFIHEYFQINVAEHVKKLELYLKDPLNIDPKSQLNQGIRDIIKDNLSYHTSEIDLLVKNMQGHGTSRYGVTVDIEFAANLLVDEELRKSKPQVLKEFAQLLTQINTAWYNKIQDYMNEVIKNIEVDVRYQKIQLRNIKLTDRNTLVTPYFTTLTNEAKTKCLNAGYIVNQNPFDEYGGLEGWHHLRRAAITWGDSLKLRYGKSPDDNPFVWDYMAKYVRNMASIFDGIRLDNLHNTPLHVAKYMLAQARSENPNLYVIGELFCDSKESECRYVQEIGINALIRELQHTNSTDDLAGYIYHNSGCKHNLIGKLDDVYQDENTKRQFKFLRSSEIQPLLFDYNHDNPSHIDRYQSQPTIMLTHAITNGLAGVSIATTYGYDIFVPKQLSVVFEKRPYPHIEFTQQLSAVTSQAQFEHTQEVKTKKISTTFSYKQQHKEEATVSLALDSTSWKPLYKLNLINGVFTGKVELAPGKYQYKYVINNGKEWKCEASQRTIDDGMGNLNNIVEVKNRYSISDMVPSSVLNNLGYIRSVMNKVHEECNMRSAEMHMVHQRENNLIMIVRQMELNDPKGKQQDYDTYVSITKVEYPDDIKPESEFATIEIPGIYVDMVFAAYLTFENPSNYYNYDPKVVNGVHIAKLHLFLNQLPPFIDIQRHPRHPQKQLLTISNFDQLPANFTIVIKTQTQDHIKQAITDISILMRYENLMNKDWIEELTDLQQFNYLLFHTHEEEMALTNGQRGAYMIDDIRLQYCGLWGIHGILRTLKDNQQLDHPLLHNVNNGNWLLDYMIQRIEVMNMIREWQVLQGFGQYMKELFDLLREDLGHLKTKIFQSVLEKLFHTAKTIYLKNTYKHLEYAQDPTAHNLLLSLSMFVSQNPQVCPHIMSRHMGTALTIHSTLPLTGISYNSRETFFAFEALFLIPKQYSSARVCILQWAALYRQGQIPSKAKDMQGLYAIYDNFDCVWWYLKALLDYLQSNEDPLSMLNMQINVSEMNIEDLIFDIFEVHREGYQLLDRPDCSVQYDETTGFIKVSYEGQKQGLSWIEQSQMPAGYIRDGALIEIQGLQACCARTVIQMKDLFSVTNQKKILKLQKLHQKLQQNFHSCYYIPDKRQLIGMELSSVRSQSEIYKDTYESSSRYPDYMFRPNVLIAMALAPELFQQDKVQSVLRKAEKLFISPRSHEQSLGFLLLDPFDKMFDDNTLCQRRYLWLLQPFIKAKINFSNGANPKDLFKYISPYLDALNDHKNIANGLSDYSGNILVKASLVSHAAVVIAINDIQNAIDHYQF